MKKQAFLYLIVLSLILTLFALPASAAQIDETEESTEATEATRAPDQCGEDIFWSFADGILTITGTGVMDDFADSAPWAEHREEITEVVLSGSITYIGANAFRDYDALQTVDFGAALTEIGNGAFYSCDGLTSVSLPATFKVFGEESFRHCKNLTQIHCAGGFPSFRLNCLWDTYATIYFPAERPWSVTYIEQLETAFHGRIEFLASDGTDPYEPTEPTEETTEPTEETTEPTEETTEPTEETTEPAEETTEPTGETTLPPSEPEETAAPETQPEQTAEGTEPSSEPEEKNGGRFTGLYLIGGVLLFVMLGILIFGRRSKGGKFAA